MSPDLVFWLGRAWYILPAISMKVGRALYSFQGTVHVYEFPALRE